MQPLDVARVSLASSIASQPDFWRRDFQGKWTTMKSILIAAALGALMFSTVAHADIGIDSRQLDQSRQIDAGKRSGKLSRRERGVLNQEQRSIKQVEARLRARGNNLSERDERRLGVLLDRAQAHIRQLKNNRERGRNGIHF